MTTTELQFMRRALALAARGQGRVEPNPMVGCVLVREGRIIAQGFHRRFGGHHAEVEALRDAQKRGADPADCTAYVTLEPCCHQGKTGPCTEALIAARVARVVTAMIDPYTAVSGRGVEALRRASVAVDVGLCEQEARALNGPFIKRQTRGLPWVIVKWAQTLDGRIAAADGSSKWISGEESRAEVHHLRGRVDAVMVGIGTALADDPLLTSRPARKSDIKRTARRVVVDPRLRLPVSSQLAKTASDVPLTIAMAEETLRDRAAEAEAMRRLGAEVIALPRLASAANPADSELDLSVLMKHLAREYSATNVLVEGGSRLIGSLWRQGLVDQVLAFVAPRVLGDERGTPAVRGLDGSAIERAARLRLVEVKRVGGDVMLDYRTAAGG